MNQKSLFDNDAAQSNGVTPIAVLGGASALTREQKQFNKLIAQINKTRAQLASWQAFMPEYLGWQSGQAQPLLAQLRVKRKAMVLLLDGVMAGKALTKKERHKVSGMLNSMLIDLMKESEDPELIPLYDKYSDISYEETQEEEAELMQAFASDVFGVKLKDDELRGSSEEVAARLAQMVEAKKLKDEARQAAKIEKAAKKNPKLGERAAAREAALAQAEQAISKTVREVYRKLASELHPDREPDAAERERKTVLMQKVNKAYGSGDLLALLELQLEIEQINPDALAGMALERLVRFILVLKEQLQRLQQELEEITGPFAMMMNSYHDLSPAGVKADFDAEISDLRLTINRLEQDLRDYQDIARLKQDLRHYKISSSNIEDEMAMLDEMLSMMPLSPRQGRRRR